MSSRQGFCTAHGHSNGSLRKCLKNLPGAGGLKPFGRHDVCLWWHMACHRIRVMDSHTWAAHADHLVFIFS